MPPLLKKKRASTKWNWKKSLEYPYWREIPLFFHTQIMKLNDSKFFAGIILIIMNIASKYITIKLSKSTETYLKYKFSRQLLIFTMAWMATRDIYISFVLTLVFIILADYAFNEKSNYCCLSSETKKFYLEREKHEEEINNKPSQADIQKSLKVLEQMASMNNKQQ